MKFDRMKRNAFSIIYLSKNFAAANCVQTNRLGNVNNLEIGFSNAMRNTNISYVPGKIICVF